MIRTRTLALLALAGLLSLLVLAACGGQAGSQQATAPAAEQPAAAAGDASRGEALFTNSGCAGCHSTGSDQIVGPGLEGVFQGEGPYGNELPNGKPITDENMMEWIKIGGVGDIGQMPGNPTLTDEQLADLVAYLKTLE
jgi:mono/diheme cytochrome c family protein